MTKATLDIVLAHTTEAKIARFFNISPSAVNQWHINGIPANRVIGLERMLDKKITRYDISPNLYPADE